MTIKDGIKQMQSSNTKLIKMNYFKGKRLILIFHKQLKQYLLKEYENSKLIKVTEFNILDKAVTCYDNLLKTIRSKVV